MGNPDDTAWVDPVKMLVTGGAGFIGSHLVDALVEDGHDVEVLDDLVTEIHPEQRWPAWCNPKARYIKGAVQNYADASDGCKDADAVFHCAARLGVQRSFDVPGEFIRSNVEGTASILKAAAARQVKTFVLSSSMGVYGENLYRCAMHGTMHPEPRSSEQLAARQWELRCPGCGFDLIPVDTAEATSKNPTSIYSLTKYDQEMLTLRMAESGVLGNMKVVVLRYFNAFGPRQSLQNPYSGVGAIFANALLRGQHPVLYEDGQQTRDFVYVSDVVRANILALQASQSEVVANVGSWQPTTVEKLAQQFAHEINPALEPQVMRTGRVGDIRHSRGYAGDAFRFLRYVPFVTLEEGVHRTADWLKAQAIKTESERRLREDV